MTKPNRAYDFFLARYHSREPFTIDDLKAATGWTGNTPETYIRKKWKDFLEKVGPNRYRVKLEFRRLTREWFLQHFSQKTPIFTRYRRRRFESVVTYELLLPMAREGELRVALDELFYADTLSNRMHELGLTTIKQWVPGLDHEPDDEYLQRAVEFVGDIFGGYSVSRVEGRFRAEGLKTRAEATTLLESYGRYLVDETTAVVRFIVRLPTSESVDLWDAGTVATAVDVDRVRRLFISLFADAVVRTVSGEDEIWLIEESDEGRRLFVWERAAQLGA